MPALAVIDLGSNGARCLVAEVKGNSRRVLLDVREPVKLAEGLYGTGSLSEAAMARAKGGGRNRVEQVELLPRLISIDEATGRLGTTIEGIERLVAEGALDPVNAGRHVRLERAAVEALARGSGADRGR